MKRLSITSLVFIAFAFSAYAQDLIIKKTSIPPIIDGIEDGIWKGTDWVKMEQHRGDAMNNNNKAQFKMTYDDDFLYVLVDVYDDKVDTSQSRNIWEKDCVELFFSMDTSSKIQCSNGTNGYWQLRKVYGREAYDYLTLGYLIAENRTFPHFMQEWRFTWNSLQTTMENTSYRFNKKQFRFEVLNSDNDGYGRNSQLFWKNNIDNCMCVVTIRAMGIVELSDNFVNLNNSEEQKSIHVYPNPVTSGQIKINSISPVKMVEIFDLKGQLLKNIKTESNDVILHLSGIKNGVYILKINTDREIYFEKLFISK